MPDPDVDEAAAPCAEPPRQLPILVTTVDIGEDQSDQIELYEGDSPEVSTASLTRGAPQGALKMPPTYSLSERKLVARKSRLICGITHITTVIAAVTVCRLVSERAGSCAVLCISANLYRA